MLQAYLPSLQPSCPYVNSSEGETRNCVLELARAMQQTTKQPL